MSAWHGGQDLGKRVCIEDLFDLGSDLGSLIEDGREGGDELG